MCVDLLYVYAPCTCHVCWDQQKELEDLGVELQMSNYNESPLVVGS